MVIWYGGINGNMRLAESKYVYIDPQLWCFQFILFYFILSFDCFIMMKEKNGDTDEL
jgi:hypothetical protein